MKRALMPVLILLVFFLGCATVQISKAEWFNDKELQASAVKLVKDYLDEQMNAGSTSPYWSSMSHAYRPLSFLNLEDWKIEGTDYSWNGNYATTPSVMCKLKAGNRFGGVAWDSYSVHLDYDKKLRLSGDQYSGLRIRSVQCLTCPA